MDPSLDPNAPLRDETATHDTKRGEDARMRLALLSEMPREWGRRVAQWLRLNRSRRSEVEDEVVPDRNIEYLFYQTLLGAWPPGLEPGDTEGTRRLAERIEAYMIKAVREGKQKSSWSNPNTAYEAALQRFVQTVLDATRANPFLVEFHAFGETLGRLGAIASLSQLVLKLTVPGVPDIYQGGELWDFSLVDPDNCRPEDWNIRQRLLEEVGAVSVADLVERWQDGREKLIVTRRLLEWRRSHPDLFAKADYQPLEVTGERSAASLCFRPQPRRRVAHRRCTATGLRTVSRCYDCRLGRGRDRSSCARSLARCVHRPQPGSAGACSGFGSTRGISCMRVVRRAVSSRNSR